MTTLEAPAKPITTEPERQRMSYEEFLAWAGEDTRAEWVNGEVILLMPPKHPHQRMVTFLDRLLGAFINLFRLGELLVAPFEVRIKPGGSSREPDLLFLSNEHLDRLTPERVAGPPDLIIEIVSDDSVHRDRVDKFDEYEAGGVREYWIVDNRPERRRVEFYQLNAQSQYQQVAVGEDGIYHSVVLPGFWLKVDWLLADDPNWLAALGQIVGPDRLVEAIRSETKKG
ncbi:MAG: Uma2 family endonuclease [Anaerolineales bacterium]